MIGSVRCVTTGRLCPRRGGVAKGVASRGVEPDGGGGAVIPATTAGAMRLAAEQAGKPFGHPAPHQGAVEGLR